jgi:hypothetical protein
MAHERHNKNGCLSRRRFLALSANAAAFAVSRRVQSHEMDAAGYSKDLAGAYRWTPDQLPKGRSTPYVAACGGRYALKTNKYLEAHVDLGQGENDCLKITGPMTITAVFQVAKQWPMRAALVSKWGFMQGEASYELGLTPERKCYFQISSSGNHDESVAEVVSDQVIELEKPAVVSAVYDPSEAMAIYVDGSLSAELTSGVPSHCYDGASSVKLLERFEGLLAGVWVHSRVLEASQVAALHSEVSEALLADCPYAEWESPKRHVPVTKPTYLGTTAGMKLVKELDLDPHRGSYVCPGDLDNDGRVDFLLYKNGSAYTVPGRLTAIDYDGRVMWEYGDRELTEHAKSGKADVGQPGTTPALRGIATICDIDEDGRSEVIAELWQDGKPMLCVFDGATGEVKHRIDSPLSMSMRQPASLGNRQPSRSHPVIRIAYINGRDKAPAIILKYGASNGIVCHAFALDSSLNILWHVEGTKNSMGHVPTVADVDGDGREEIVLGHMLVDHDGAVVWDKGRQFEWHADATAVAGLIPGQGNQVLISVCGIGPVYCLSPAGQTMWQKRREEIAHGQAVWVGNFIPNRPGKEVIACASGHVGSFVTLDGATGTTLARFEHKKIMPSYPDFPAVVNWQSREIQSLWIPQDRTLVDGYGNVVAELGEMDAYVQKKLHCGTSWRPVGAQAFALDIMGDDRDELILYEPYEGESIFIFSNPDSDQTPKRYVPQANAYNIRSYF